MTMTHCLTLGSFFRLAVVLGLAVLGGTAMAQYPNKPIRIEVGFVAGGTPDVVARVFAQKLTAVLGQPVIVENKSGSAGNIAADAVANAPADGYTLLLGVDSQFVVNPHLYPKMTDPFKALVPVSSLVSNQFYIAVTPSLPVNNFSEFIEYAKKAKPPLAYGTAGNGSQSHLGMEMLKKRAGIDLIHVPYRGAGQSTVAAMAGEVQIIMSGSILPQIESGKLKALAVTTPNRLKSTPNLPAIAEFYPGYEMMIWLGLFTATGTPEPVILRLRKAVDEILVDPDTVALLEKLRLHPYTSSREAFSTLMRKDYDKYGKLVKELGVTVE
jgi:tripartite-type tricarboxylate transporter receptor subunit TctC